MGIRPGRHTTKDRLYLAVFLVAAAAYIVLIAAVNQSVARLGAQMNKDAAPAPSLIKHIALIPGRPAIGLIKDNSFRINTRWVYVSPSQLLPEGYIPSGLEDITEPQAASDTTFQLQHQANTALVKLFDAAKSSGHSLIVSSAYRSEAMQIAVYDTSMTTSGSAYTLAHVALPRASEHQTGLAVDINSYSSACEADATVCSLAASDAAWLEAHAPDYGFILRYPTGKEAVTGIGNEPWHFRYIGSDARTLTDSGLTLDEFVKIANAQQQ